MRADLPFKSPTVFFKELDEGAVLFCSRTEVYFGLNELGVLIWSGLPDSPAAGRAKTLDLLKQLRERFPDVDGGTLEADAAEFLDALAENELVAYGVPDENGP